MLVDGVQTPFPSVFVGCATCATILVPFLCRRKKKNQTAHNTVYYNKKFQLIAFFFGRFVFNIYFCA